MTSRESCVARVNIALCIATIVASGCLSSEEQAEALESPESLELRAQAAAIEEPNEDGVTPCPNQYTVDEYMALIREATGDDGGGGDEDPQTWGRWPIYSLPSVPNVWCVRSTEVPQYPNPPCVGNCGPGRSCRIARFENGVITCGCGPLTTDPFVLP